MLPFMDPNGFFSYVLSRMTEPEAVMIPALAKPYNYGRWNVLMLDQVKRNAWYLDDLQQQYLRSLKWQK
jgi:hypothetical protein